MLLGLARFLSSTNTCSHLRSKFCAIRVLPRKRERNPYYFVTLKKFVRSRVNVALGKYREGENSVKIVCFSDNLQEK